MSQNGKLMPNLDQRSTKLLNLTVLQLIDPFTDQILITSARVTLYEFDIDHNSEGCGRISLRCKEGILGELDLTMISDRALPLNCEVSPFLLFIFRNTQPRFQFIVMNRRSTAQEVNGIWFYHARECEEVANLFSRILGAYSKVPQKLLPTRKSEFEELEAFPTMAVMDGPLEPSSSTLSNVTDAPGDPSFVNFFSAALTMKNSSNTAISGDSFQPAISIPGPSRPVSSPSLIFPPPPSAISSKPLPLLESVKSETSIIRPTNLVKPSSFFTLPSSSPMLARLESSSVPTAPALQQVVPRLFGTPMLQPLPPPAPPPSLTPSSLTNPIYRLAFSRDHVRDEPLVIVQDDRFIDMVYQALQNAHQS